jgi:two-component system, OmpR family, phosphate regulon sensor histidine kinase PhoR
MWVIISILLLACGLALHLFWLKQIAKARFQLAHLRTRLRAIEEEQAQSVAQSRLHQFAILNSVIEGVLVLDRDGRVQTVNKSLERLFRLNGDIRGQTLMEAFRAHELLELWERVAKEEQVREFELTVPGIQETRYFEVNAAAIGGRKYDPGGTVMVFHDFTRLKELENVRKEFVANVSHELRTPLTLIKGYIETLLDGAKDDPSVATRFLQKIEKHTARLTFLIEDLLTLSQLEAGQTLMHQQTVPLAPIVDRVIEELQKPAIEKKIVLQNEIDPELEAYVDGDRIQQVFYNLVDNAIKYGREDGFVSVRAQTNPNELDIAVEDDGRGIPEDAQQRVFERFYRVDRARSRDAGGTGLGLAIVKHIVQAHRGKVWVESQLDQGSAFHFTLPALTQNGAKS